MSTLQKQLVAALEFIRDDRGSGLSYQSQLIIRGALTFADEAAVEDIFNPTNDYSWKSIDNDGQPTEAGTYEVRYVGDSETDDHFNEFYYDGSLWRVYKGQFGVSISFGNESTEGEFYRKMKQS
jgi:hypothetical protein